MDDNTLITFAYVDISTYRKKTVKTLNNNVKTSKVLRELKEKNVVECINEDAKKGRLYRLTSLGEEIAKKLD